MNVNIQQWDESFQNFEKQVNVFNDKIQSVISEEELDQIYRIVKTELKRLKNFAEEAHKQQEKFEGSGRCCDPIPKALWIIGTVNGISKVCEIGGASIGVFGNEPISKYLGLALFTAGEIIDVFSTLYETKINLDLNAIVQLAKVNQEGVEHAKIFKKFIKELKEIKHKEKENMEKARQHEKQPFSDKHIIIDLETKELDRKITVCLNQYEELPSRYRQDHIYCRIVSVLLQQLPENDPLRIELSDIEPMDLQKMEEDRSPPINYLTRSNSQLSILTSPKETSHWNYEEQSRHSENEKIDPERITAEYIKQLSFYKHKVIQRFRLKRNFQFIDTENGWRIDCEKGIMRIPSFSKNLDIVSKSKESPKNKNKLETV